MSTKVLLRTIAAVTIFSSLAGFVHAQRTTASVTGVVRDAFGAVVASVSLQITNLDTNQVHQTVTNDLGVYLVNNLAIGRYSLSAEKNGFKTAKIPEVILRLDQDVRIDINLEVGAIAQSVDITAATPLVSADNADVGQVIENKYITELPLNGRNFAQLIGLAPGAFSGPQRNSISGHSVFIVNGNRATSISHRLDGIDNQDQSFDTFGVQPSIDAIQEFKLQSTAYTAENGRGLVYVNVALKSGGNRWHGQLSEFLRNDKFDAREFFDGSTIPPLKRNQFGGSLGGPIVKNKAFFFLNYEGLRERSGNTFTSTVATAEMRSGNYTGLRPIFDPSTYNSASRARSVFPGNVIPTSRIDPASRTLVDNWYPAPNAPGTARNFNVSPVATSTNDQFHARTDYNISDRDTVFFRYSFSRELRFLPKALVNQGGEYNQPRYQNGVFSYNRLFSAAALNSFRFGINRINHTAFTQNADKDVIAQLGLRGLDSRLSFPWPNGGVPNISVSGYAAMGEPQSRPIRRPQEAWNWKDDFSYNRGKHAYQFGLDIRTFMTSAMNPLTSRGIFSFTGTYTQNNASPAGTGDGFADLLLGLPASASHQNPRLPYYNYWKNFHFYAQDEWKATRRLTINYGLRYEVNTPTVELRGSHSTFDPVRGAFIVADTDSPLPGAAVRVYREASPAALSQYAGRILTSKEAPEFPGDSLRITDRNNFAPRIGLAFRPFGRSSTAIRIGYGVFYSVMNGNLQSYYITVPFVLNEQVLNPTPVPNFGFRDALDNPATIPTPATWSLQRDLREAYTHNWSFNIQHQLMGDLMLDVGYVANKATRLERVIPLNNPDPGPGAVQARRPFPYIAGLSGSENNGNSVYHSLQAKAEKRFSKGLSFLVSYTYSKLISESSDLGGQGTGFRDQKRLWLERGVDDFDLTHNFTATYVYELPVGRGRRFATSANRLLDGILGGWQLTGILALRSGDPFTPGMSTDVANIGTTNRPDRLANGKLENPTIDRWFDVKAFAIPAQFTIGNTGRNILRSDGTETFDLGLFKNFQIAEGQRLELRSEFFNVLNHPVFGTPNVNIQNANAGIVSSASSGRIIQFALKYVF